MIILMPTEECGSSGQWRQKTKEFFELELKQPSILKKVISCPCHCHIWYKKIHWLCLIWGSVFTMLLCPIEISCRSYIILSLTTTQISLSVLSSSVMGTASYCLNDLLLYALKTNLQPLQWTPPRCSFIPHSLQPLPVCLSTISPIPLKLHPFLCRWPYHHITSCQNTTSLKFFTYLSRLA